jgi:CRP-like cAMP-binding protein
MVANTQTTTIFQSFVPILQSVEQTPLVFLESLSDLEREQLFSVSFPRKFEQGEVLFRTGEVSSHLFVIERGKVKLTRSSNQERILQVAGEGDVLGIDFLNPNTLHAAEAICLSERNFIYALSREEFLLVAQRFPSIIVKLSRTLSQQVSLLSDQLELANAPVMLRIGHTILSLTKRFGEVMPEGWTFLAMPLSQEELASIAGTTRVSFTQNMRILRELDLVQGTRGNYRIRVNALEHLLQDILWED